MNFVGDVEEVPFSTIKDELVGFFSTRSVGSTVEVQLLAYSGENHKFFALYAEGGREFSVEVLKNQGIWNIMEIKEEVK